MYPVETQAIWSSVAPRFPIMCGIATLTMLVSSSSSTDASETVIAMRYLKRYLSGAAAGIAIAVMLVRLDGRHDAHARPQHMLGIHGAVQMNAHRDPLHHLREVAGRVVRRQQRELRAGRGRQAFDVAAEMHALVRID